MNPGINRLVADLRDIRAGNDRLAFDEAAAAFAFEEDEQFRMTGRVAGEVRFSVQGAGQVRARGQCRATAETQCARCLEAITIPIEAPIEALFEKDEDLLKPDAEVFGRSPDETVCYFDGERVNVAEAVREAVALELPATPLCSDDCPGLDPATGEKRARPGAPAVGVAGGAAAAATAAPSAGNDASAPAGKANPSWEKALNALKDVQL